MKTKYAFLSLALLCLVVSPIVVYGLVNWTENCNNVFVWTQEVQRLNSFWEIYTGDSAEGGASLRVYCKSADLSIQRPYILISTPVVISQTTENTSSSSYYLSFSVKFLVEGRYDPFYSTNKNYPAVYLEDADGIVTGGIAIMGGRITSLYGIPTTVGLPSWGNIHAVNMTSEWHTFKIFISPHKQDVYFDGEFAFTCETARRDSAPVKLYVQNSCVESMSEILVDKISVSDFNSADITSSFNLLSYLLSLLREYWWLILIVIAVVVLILSSGKRK